MAWEIVITCGFSVFNYAAFYLIGIMLAKNLLPADYGDYCAAVATANILATIGTLGLEKAATKAFPDYITNKKFDLARGFWRFGIFIVIVASTILALGTIGFHEIWAQVKNEVRHPLVLLLLFLPIVTLTTYATEALTGLKRVMPSILISWGLLPSTALAVMWLVSRYFGRGMTSSHAVVALGTSWIVTLIVILPLMPYFLPAGMRKSEPSYHWKTWINSSLGFLANSLILTVLNNGVLIVLEFFHPDEDIVGVFGAVLQTSGFVVLLATSTNRLFLPRISKALAQGDNAGVRSILRSRTKVVGPLLAFSFLAFFLFGEQILDLFRHHTHEITHAGRIGPYAERGYLALIVSAAGTTVSSWFAIAPYLLMYMGRTREVLWAIGSASLAAIVSAVFLSRLYNELGAAVANAVPLALAFLWMGMRVRTKVREKD